MYIYKYVYTVYIYTHYLRITPSLSGPFRGLGLRHHQATSPLELAMCVVKICQMTSILKLLSTIT